MLTNREGKPERIFFRTAMVAPVVQAASRCSWAAALGIGVLCAGICRLQEKLGTPEQGWLSAVKWIWLIVIGGSALRWIGYGWQTSAWVIPGTILVLSAWTAAGGSGKSVAAGNVLRFGILALLGTILVSGLWDIRVENLKPGWTLSGAELITVLLFPAAFPTEGRKKAGWFLLTLAGVTAIVTAGVLTEGYALRHDSPFFELSKNVQLLGTAKRYESLGAAGLTLGYYVFFTCLLRGCADLGEAMKVDREKGTVWLSAAGMAIGYGLEYWQYEEILALGSALLFGLLPLIAGAAKRVKMKKLRKNEKSA